MRHALVAIVLTASACAAKAPAPAPDLATPPALPADVTWPREVKEADGTAITVYQPQLDQWADNALSGRAAVSVTRSGDKQQHFGVIDLGAHTAIDKSTDLVTLSAVRITKGSFPGTSQEDSDKYLAAIRASLGKLDWPVSAQALQANLAIVKASAQQKALPLKNDPPQILFRTGPSLLVLIDGEPALREVKDAPGLMRVINTTALILLEQSSATYYLRALDHWWQAKSVEGGWKEGPSRKAELDRVREALGKEFDPLEGKEADGKPTFGPGVMPQIVVATRPTELLQAKGAPEFSPIDGTQLLYMSNSRNDIFLELGSQIYYVLISGRWFSAKDMSGPWRFVPGGTLPADFSRIPPNNPMADVMMSVPGTAKAREAAIANTIPQTATVLRDVKPTPVTFDGGKPEWKPVEGTPLSYAFNTASPLIRIDPNTYYMVQNGVWFSGTAPAGPWAVAAVVPTIIYTIPPSSPIHYVTYVRVYSSTPTTVFVGYTPGYYGSVLSSDGVVVYGTGYAYPVYIGSVWYPPPPTYGFGVGFASGVFFGFAMGAVMAPWHYGGCCYSSSTFVVHHSNVTINNTYNRWGRSSTIGNTTFAKGAGGNNVFAGHDGQVYRHDSGQWQKYQGGGLQGGGGWSDMEKGNLSGETRTSLDQQFQSREAGTQRANEFRQGGGDRFGGFGGGGGGDRFGGGGFGGFGGGGFGGRFHGGGGFRR